MQALRPRGGGDHVAAKITHLREAAANHARYSAHNCKWVTRAIEPRCASLEGGKRVKSVRLNHLRAALLAVAAAGCLLLWECWWWFSMRSLRRPTFLANLAR